MLDWSGEISAGCELSADAVQDLRDFGFVVIPGLIDSAKGAQLAAAYDSAVDSANSGDMATGSTTTRVSDFVNRGSAFDEIYIFQPVLEACYAIIGQPFKLSTMHARTLRPHSPTQALHVDFEHDSDGFPMIGYPDGGRIPKR